MIKAGLVVNPIAGMGGNVGLKGTDGGLFRKAIELGARPSSGERMREVLSLVTRKDLYFLCGPGAMGEDCLKGTGFEFRVVGKIGAETSAQDTKAVVREMLREGIRLLIFVGGDGTARDVLDVVGLDTPVIAVPAGVKMFSAAFAISAHAAAEMINTFGQAFTEKEILDIDEEAFRDNRLVAKPYGVVMVPDIQHLLQGKKTGSAVQGDVVDKKKEVARFIVENMVEDVLYILGPGTTLKTVTDALGLEKTLLGIDAVINGKLAGKDLNENQLLSLIEKFGKVKIIVTPIGGSGYIFGRGSRQISSKVLALAGKKNVMVASTLDKVGGLDCLRVDTGDYEVDRSISGKIPVIIGYKEEIIMEVKC